MRMPGWRCLLLALALLAPVAGHTADCRLAVREAAARLPERIDERELLEALQSLNATGQQRLPEKFLSKREAQAAGWRPGRDLWSVPALRGKSIGGDRFGNRERALPNGRWREADLDYRGGRRNAKRLIFSDTGRRFVTVDHYRSFTEVPACQP